MKVWRGNVNEHFVELTLPDTLRWVEAQNLTGCEKVVQTENGISYIGNWVVHADNSLTSIVLRDGTVGIANRAISNENLKSIMIPASLKTICGSIVDENVSGRSLRELYISNLAAWCAVRCIDYNDSRFLSFTSAPTNQARSRTFKRFRTFQTNKNFPIGPRHHAKRIKSSLPIWRDPVGKFSEGQEVWRVGDRFCNAKSCQ